MANNLTAIELGARTVSAVQARANGQGLQIVKAATSAIAAVDPESIRTALKDCGVEGGRALLLVQRAQALLRDLELPEGSPDELVSMVRFQVERELPLPLEQVRYSYIETGRSGGKVRIQVVAVPRDVLDPAIAAVEGAGVEVSNVYISSFGLLSLYPGGDSAALIEVSGGEAEILIIDGGRMESSRTVHLPEGGEGERTAEEVERTLLSFAAKSPLKEIRKIVLAGEGQAASELAQMLRTRLRREVIQVGPGDLETAAAVGICLGVSQGRPLPDLLHPPAAARRFRPTKVHRIAALSVGVLLALFIWGQVALADRNAALALKRKQLADLQPKAARVTLMEQRIALAQQWYRDRNLWVDVLKSLRSGVNTNYLWIVGTTFEDTGSIRIQGKSRDDKHVTDLVSSLEKTALFQSVKNEKMSPSNDKSEYKYEFTLTAYLKNYDPKKKKTP